MNTGAPTPDTFYSFSTMLSITFSNLALASALTESIDAFELWYDVEED